MAQLNRRFGTAGGLVGGVGQLDGKVINPDDIVGGVVTQSCQLTIAVAMVFHHIVSLEIMGRGKRDGVVLFVDGSGRIECQLNSG